MSFLGKLFRVGVGVAAVGAAAYWLKHHTGNEYEDIITDESTDENIEDISVADVVSNKTDDTKSSVDDKITDEETNAASSPAKYAGDEAPNPNPVESGRTEAVPTMPDGKLDATKIADPADFGDWEEQGCKG